MKLTIPQLLKRAIDQNDMKLVAKAYTAITGESIAVQSVASEPEPVAQQRSNTFVDDGTIARKDSAKHNDSIAKLYNSPTQRRAAAQRYTLHCSCGVVETVPESQAAYYNQPDQKFVCQQCLLQKSRG